MVTALRGDVRVGVRTELEVGVEIRSPFISESRERRGELVDLDGLFVRVALFSFSGLRSGAEPSLPEQTPVGVVAAAADVPALDGLREIEYLLKGLWTGVAEPLLDGEKHILDGLSVNSAGPLLGGLSPSVSGLVSSPLGGRFLGDVRVGAALVLPLSLSHPARNADDPGAAEDRRVGRDFCRAVAAATAEVAAAVAAAATTGSLGTPDVPRTRPGRHVVPVSRQTAYSGRGDGSGPADSAPVGLSSRSITSVESSSAASPGQGSVRHRRRCRSSDTVASWSKSGAGPESHREYTGSLLLSLVYNNNSSSNMVLSVKLLNSQLNTLSNFSSKIKL